MRLRLPTARLGKVTSIVILLLVLLIVLRLLLPTIVLRYVNRELARIPDYRGSVEEVGIALFRGAYTVHNFTLQKLEGEIPVPFVSAREIDFSVRWSDLFDGKVVGEISASGAELNFVRADSDARSQTTIDAEWLAVVKDLFPLRINRFEIRDSEIHYRDFDSEPKVDVVISEVRIVGENFSNTRSPTIGEPAPITGSGKLQNVAPVKLNAAVYPAAKEPTFELDASLESLPLETVNDFFEAYGAFEAKGGESSLYADFAAAENKFRGSVKPIVKDIEIKKFESQSNPLRLIWDGVVSVAAGILENRSKDQIATTIPFEGTFDDPETSVWETILGLLRNAFIQPLSAGSNEEISLEGLLSDGE